MFDAQILRHGLIYENETQMYPSNMIGHIEGKTQITDKYSTHFGVCIDGVAHLEVQEKYPLSTGMYFSVPGPLSLSGDARVVIFQRIGYLGLFQIGGPIESQGRLRYIDNCSTTLLCSPPRDGDPCLNLLHFPPETKQTAHIHPTLRLGLVLSGGGFCYLQNKKIPLQPGQVFAIEPGAVHCFHSSAEGLRVIAYHPDSEGGPTDQSHPMLNRTYIQGAANLV